MKALALDLGGTHATCGLVEERTLLASETIDTDHAKSLAALLPTIAKTFRDLVQRESLSLQDLAGTAVGFAGLVDSRIGRVVATNGKYEDATEIDLNAWSQKAFGIPLRIEND